MIEQVFRSKPFLVEVHDKLYIIGSTRSEDGKRAHLVIFDNVGNVVEKVPGRFTSTSTHVFEDGPNQIGVIFDD